MSDDTEAVYRFWIASLMRAFPDMEPFTQPIGFVQQLRQHIQRKENAALQRAINVIRAHYNTGKKEDEKACAEMVRLVRRCMKDVP